MNDGEATGERSVIDRIAKSIGLSPEEIGVALSSPTSTPILKRI